ncbi:MAG: hypothetical protein J1F32_02750 [Erysipelotrichales bacterium]|nr:hypothetical protein [Erysipelotrichales bacterium]
MIHALKKKSTIILASIISSLIVAFFVVSIVLEQALIVDELPYNLPVALVLILIVLILVAFVTSDTYVAKYRKKNNLLAGPLPVEVKQKVWDIITPWLIAIIVTILIATLDTLIWRI